MGSQVVIEITGSPEHLEHAQRRLIELEQRWSRFRPSSDITRCNTTRGLPVTVHADTRTLVRHGIQAWKLTGGRCDPSVVDAMIANGYDRSFAEIGTATAPPMHQVARGCGDIVVDDAMESITMPHDVGFDPGAIGKGLAADILVEEVLAAGADGVFVSLGGDIRCGGSSPGGDGWRIPIVEPSLGAGALGTLRVSEGAVTTSTDRRRRWTQDGRTVHHIVDPATGRNAVSAATLVTVIAADGWWAEAVATELYLATPGEWERIVTEHRVAAFIVDHDGRHHLVGPIQDYLS